MKNLTIAEIREWLIGMFVLGIFVGMWGALYVVN